MSLFDEPFSTFVPGLLIAAGLCALGWLMMRLRQAGPAAAPARERGWRFEHDGHISGSLPGIPGCEFRARSWDTLALSEREHGEEGLSGFEWQMAMHGPDARAQAEAGGWRLPQATDREAWRALLTRHLGAFEDTRWQFEAKEWTLRVQVDGVPVLPDSAALIRVIDACLGQLRSARAPTH
jgi:hypothetical protein